VHSIQIIALRHTNPEIAREIQCVLRSAYTVEAELIGVDDFPPLRRSVSQIEGSNTEFYGVHSRGKLCAVIELERKSASKDWLGVSSLCVTPSRAREGLGSALIDFALSLGANSVEVSTASANLPAISLYEKKGFRIMSREINEHEISIVHMKTCVHQQSPDL